MFGNLGKIRQKLLLLFLLIGLLLSPILLFKPVPALASSFDLGEPVNAPENLNPVITHFLEEIPPRYYAIMKIQDLQNLIQQGDLVLIDVREPSEYAFGHIPTAINIPLRSLTQNIDQIPKDRPVVLYCTTGYRTAMGVMALELLGYQNVRGFPPSIQGWKAAGQVLETVR
ncbi:rhodanese-like domain-containing protein [Planktothrix mougeotii]|uniref:Rhodanese-like domain-containing protein n=1 Tax=Planktothrix mougeotii LEGE 06226 TaxID=1828728 RepID=A0ABR9UBC0_9CYAN|nr:rhodanese-like domain-containing protein [Planktothrix mougeotii]MBE9143762.1 rhodanese-like domain-containing protein [Planktothrix mougeotii LEGE 06226]